MLVADGDNVFRNAIDPVAFRGRHRIFDHQKLIAIRENEKNPLVLETSVVWERLAPTLEKVHAFGCRTAYRRNHSPSRREGASDQIYCGAYQLVAGTVRKDLLSLEFPEIACADVVHVVEDGELAHCNIAIYLAPDFDEKRLEGIKTWVMNRLWARSAGPLKHTCNCDRELSPHPQERLHIPPRGQYIDERCTLDRWRATVAAFLLIYWLTIKLASAKFLSGLSTI